MEKAGDLDALSRRGRVEAGARSDCSTPLTGRVQSEQEGAGNPFMNGVTERSGRRWTRPDSAGVPASRVAGGSGRRGRRSVAVRPGGGVSRLIVVLGGRGGCRMNRANSESLHGVTSRPGRK